MKKRRYKIKQKMDFDFDLQLFGGGNGKTGLKIGLTLFIGAFSAGAIFGASPWFAAAGQVSWVSGLMGMSLFSSIWSSFSRKDTSSSNGTVQRFDKVQETMSSAGAIPIVYGLRKLSGNQTYHYTNADQNILKKHVVICEGGIEGVYSVEANDLLIPDRSQVSDGYNGLSTVFTLTNIKHSDARVIKNGKSLKLICAGTVKEIYLCNEDDADNLDTMYEWQVSISSLISYINRIGDGWQAFPFGATSKFPADMENISGNCYNTYLSFMSRNVLGDTYYTFYDSVPPSNYSETGGYPNLAWFDMTFAVSSELNGNPSVSCIVKGRKVYDPRTKKTKYSANPALCLLDFMLSERFGLGKWIKYSDIDEDSFIEAADYCDEEIHFNDASGVYVKAKRYELNMIIDTKRSAIEWLQEILANFCGYLVFSNGKLKLKIEKETPVSYKFTDDTCFDLKIEPLALKDTPNRYEVSIVDPYNNWAVVKCICDDYADQKSRQKIITKEVSLDGVTSQYQALRLARFYRDYNLVCPLQIQFTTGQQAMHLEPGDVVTISYHKIFENLPIRISEIKETEKGTYEIAGRQYNDTIYNDALGGGIHWYKYQTAEAEIKYHLGVPTITASSAFREYQNGSSGYDVTVKFALPKYADYVEVQYKKNTLTVNELGSLAANVASTDLGYGEEWTKAGDGTSQVIISYASMGDVYMIRARSCDENNIKSKWCDPIYCKVTKRETIPAQPFNLWYDFSKSLYFHWSDVENSDAVYYELRTNEMIGSTEGLIGRSTTNFVVVDGGLSRKGKAWLYAVNAQKQYSYPATCEWEVPYPDAPILWFQETPRGINICTDPFPVNVHYVRYYITGSAATGYSNTITSNKSIYNFTENNSEPTYSADAESTDTSTTDPVAETTTTPQPDIYTVYATYIDIFGEGFKSQMYNFEIKPVFDGAWIEDHTIAEEKVGVAIKDALNAGRYSRSEIVQIVADTQEDADASQWNYSAITQLKDVINFRVQGEQLISQINITKYGVHIDGKYLHVTGDTYFDNNVIVGGYIAAGAITGDKISSNLITLNGNQGFKGNSVSLTANGMQCLASDGTSVKFDSRGMTFLDRNGFEYYHVGRMIIGQAKDGQRIKFSHSWTSAPLVIVSPISIPMGLKDYSAQDIWMDVHAENVSRNGFNVVCQSVLTAGSSVTKTSPTLTANNYGDDVWSDNILNYNAEGGVVTIHPYFPANPPAGTIDTTYLLYLNGEELISRYERYEGDKYSPLGNLSAEFVCPKGSDMRLRIYGAIKGASVFATIKFKTDSPTAIGSGTAFFIAMENNADSYSVS